MNRRTWIASVGTTLFVTRFPGLRDKTTLLQTVTADAVGVDFSNDAIWNELATETFAATARTTPFDPEGGASATGSPDEPGREAELVTSMALLHEPDA